MANVLNAGLPWAEQNFSACAAGTTECLACQAFQCRQLPLVFVQAKSDVLHVA